MASVSVRQLKVLATLLLAAPGGVLLLFLVGEVAGGDISGLQHLVQLLPLVALGTAAWRYPRAGGAALMAVGLGLALLFPLAMGGAPRGNLLFGEVVLFAPSIIAGLLFLLAGLHRTGDLS